MSDIAWLWRFEKLYVILLGILGSWLAYSYSISNPNTLIDFVYQEFFVVILFAVAPVYLYRTAQQMQFGGAWRMWQNWLKILVYVPATCLLGIAIFWFWFSAIIFVAFSGG